MDIADVLAGLKAALAGVKDSSGKELHAYDHTPNQIVEPAFYPRDYTIDPHVTFKNRWQMTVTFVLLVAATNAPAQQKRLAKFLSSSGTASVHAALMAARGAPGELALGGAADDLTVKRLGPPRMYELGTGSYYGAEIEVMVMGSPDG